jgi:hypothetical protein
MYGNLMKNVPHCRHNSKSRLALGLTRDPQLKVVLTTTAKIKVQKKAPTNPSTVFFGLNLKRGVFPKVLPEKDNTRSRSA